MWRSALLLAAVPLALGLAACGDEGDNDGGSNAAIIETECQRWFNHINNLPCTPPAN